MTNNQENAVEDRPWWRTLPILVAICISFVVAISAFIIVGTKNVLSLDANEIGDFLAGFAGTLSFVWIIAAIFLQKEELSLQRRELRNQIAETKRLAESAEGQLSAVTTTLKIQVKERLLSLFSDLQESYTKTLESNYNWLLKIAAETIKKPDDKQLEMFNQSVKRIQLKNDNIQPEEFKTRLEDDFKKGQVRQLNVTILKGELKITAEVLIPNHLFNSSSYQINVKTELHNISIIQRLDEIIDALEFCPELSSVVEDVVKLGMLPSINSLSKVVRNGHEHPSPKCLQLISARMAQKIIEDTTNAQNDSA